MKYFSATLLLIIIHSVLIPNTLLSSNDNQLVTEIRNFDNDTTFRYLYMYDGLGNKVLETRYFQQDSIWIRKSLNEWVFDGNNCTTQRESQWTNSGWMITYTIDYTYNNNQEASEVHNLYSHGIASLLKKISFQYDSSTLNSKKEYAWQSNSWMLALQSDFRYLPNGKTDSIITTSFQPGNVNSQIHSKFYYNLDGTLQSQLMQEKDSNNNWLNTELINWFYTATTSNVVSLRNKKWNTETSNWENTQRIDYQYNDSLRLLSESYQRWNAMFWENDVRYDYQYDNHNNLLKKTLSKPIYNDWRGLISINYSNFTMNCANTIESQYEFWGGNTGDLTTSFIPFLFNNEMTIQKGRHLELSYLPVLDTELFTPVDNNSMQRIPVYPNPSDGIFYIDTQKYSISSWMVSDLNGQILKKQVQSFQSGVIDLTELPKGIYLLRVTTQDQQMIQKLIKE